MCDDERGICETRRYRRLACRLVIARLENRVCLINFRASMDVCFIAGASDIVAVGSNIGRKAGRQHYLLSEGERGRMPSPRDHHGNPYTARHGVVSCVLLCPASMATANLPKTSSEER